MSQLITEAHVSQFRANLYMLAQQKGSLLRSATRQESQSSKKSFFDRIGAVTAVKKTGRHSPTPQLDTPHSRRMVTLNDYEWADLIDIQDKIRMLIDPASPYAQSAMMALGRTLDDEIIAALVGTAYAGEDGATAVALGTAQRLVPLSGVNQGNLNVAALRKAKFLMDSAQAPKEGRFMAINASALESLLGETAVTSSDYNTVKALVQGDLETFLGFKFVMTERLPTSAAFTFNTTSGLYQGGGTASDAASKSCVAWVKDGLISSVGQEPVARTSERDDLSYATQVYASMSFGAVRMEEAKVVEILCKQA